MDTTREEAVQLLLDAIYRRADESKYAKYEPMPPLGPEQGYVANQIWLRVDTDKPRILTPGKITIGQSKPRPLSDAALDYLAEHYGTPKPSLCPPGPGIDGEAAE